MGADPLEHSGQSHGAGSRPPLAAQEWLTTSAVPYVSLVLVSVVAGQLANYLWLDHAVFKGQAPVILVQLAGVAAATALWLAYRRSIRPAPFAIVFAAALAGLWVWAMVSSYIDGAARSYLAFLVPLLLALVLVKPPRSKDVDVAGLVFAWSIVLVAAVGEVHAALFGRMPQVVFGMPWEWLASLGITDRWAGPFINVNYAGPIGAYTLVFSLARSGRSRWILVAVGTAMLLASASRTAIIGALVGCLVLITFSTRRPWSLVSVRLRAALAVAGALVLGLLAYLHDPTFDLRTPGWGVYIQQWQTNPWWGLGEARIGELVRTEVIPYGFLHAHNIWVDVLARFGVVGLVLLAATLGAALVGAVKAVSSQCAWPLALVSAFLVIGFTETPGDWTYWTIPALWLLLGVMKASALSSRGTRRQ